MNPRRLGFLVHDRDIAERPLPVVGGARRGDREGEEAREAGDDPHHGASMTSDRRKATTPSRLGGSSAR